MSKSKTVKDIIVEYLKANGFDGLCGDGCGCDIDHLAPCESDCTGCKPAYKTKCLGKQCKNPCYAYCEAGKTDCFMAEKTEEHTPCQQCGEAQDVTCAECEAIQERDQK